jgi:hypothetical protein
MDSLNLKPKLMGSISWTFSPQLQMWLDRMDKDQKKAALAELEKAIVAQVGTLSQLICVSGLAANNSKLIEFTQGQIDACDETDKTIKTFLDQLDINRN